MIKNIIKESNKKNNKDYDNTDENCQKIINKDTRFDVKEAYNELRTNLMFSIPSSKTKVVSVTSSIASEGKSTTCLNTAISFADIYGKTIVVDCDLRRPNVDKLLGIGNKKGLSNLLVNDCKFDEAVFKTEYKNLDALIAGNIPPNPTELLSSDAMAKLIDELKEKYEYIFLDTPPINIVIDASILVKHVDGVVVVVRQQMAEKKMLQEAVKKLKFANAKILGFVLNDVPSVNKRYATGKYGYSRYSSDK